MHENRDSFLSWRCVVFSDFNSRDCNRCLHTSLRRFWFSAASDGLSSQRVNTPSSPRRASTPSYPLVLSVLSQSDVLSSFALFFKFPLMTRPWSTVFCSPIVRRPVLKVIFVYFPFTFFLLFVASFASMMSVSKFMPPATLYPATDPLPTLYYT